jgi:hypothetical protein
MEEETTEEKRELISSPLEESTLSERLGQAARGYIPPLAGLTAGFLASGNMLGAGIGMTITSIAAGTYRLGKVGRIPKIELEGYGTGTVLGTFLGIYEATSRLL